MNRTLSVAEAREVISSGKVGRLGCVDRGEPYVVPINYLCEDRFIYSHSLPGRKIDVMRSHPRACLQVDRIDDELHWRSAIAFGNFEEVRTKDREVIMSKMLLRYPRLTPVESMIVQDAAAAKIIVYRIRIDRITGAAED